MAGLRAAWLLYLLAWLPMALAGAQTPTLSRVEPRAVQRGQEAQLVLHGSTLIKPSDLLFDRPGIEVLEVDPRNDKKVRIKLRVASDAAQGRYALRLRTQRGLSNLVLLRVSDLALVAAEDSDGQPQDIALDQLVGGILHSGDEDVFRFEGTAGERIHAMVEAMRLGGTFLDTQLVLENEAGRVLVESDDHPLTRQDPLLQAVLPADGRYTLRLREVCWRGDRRGQYLLHLRRGPQPEMSEPLAIAEAQDRSLGEWIPAGVQPHYPEGASTVIWRRPSRLETVQEQDGELAGVLSFPGAGEGRLDQAGDEDRWTLQVKKGQRIRVEVFARRLRSPIDAVLDVVGSDGKRKRGRDDGDSMDPVMEFEAKASGEVGLIVLEHLGRGFATGAYRIEVTRPIKRLQVDLAGQVEELVVPRGGRVPLGVTVERGGVRGPIDLQVSGMPPGVRVDAPTLAANSSQASLVFHAAADAPGAGSLLRLRAGQLDEEQGLQSASDLHQTLQRIPGRNNTYYLGWTQDRLPLAVTKAVPFDVELRVPKVPLLRSGRLRVQIQVKRKKGFDGELLVGLAALPQGVTAVRTVRLKPGKSRAEITLEASGEARIGRWPLVAFASGTVEGVNVTNASEHGELELTGRWLTASAKDFRLERQGASELVLKLGRTGACPAQPARLRVEGLPYQVEAEAIDLPATMDAPKLVFRAGAKAPIGKRSGLRAIVRFELEGGTTEQVLALPRVRVSAAPAPPAAEPEPQSKPERSGDEG